MRQKEHLEAVRFMRAVDGFRGKPGLILQHPCLKWLHHIPNGGARNKVVAGKLKAEGVRAGVSDYFLPSPMITLVKGEETLFYCGLYLELKATGNTYPTEDQKAFLKDMDQQGYAVACVRGAAAALDILTAYLEGKWTNDCTKIFT